MYHPLMWIFKGPSAIFPYSRAEGMSPYKERFCENVLVNRDGAKGHYKTLPYPKNPVDLWNFLSKLVVRRTRQDPVYLESLTELNLKLPLEDPQVIPVRMVPPQALLMLNSIDQFKEEFKEYCAEVEANGHAVNSTIVIGQMSRMKIAATCPAMLNEKDKPIIYDGGDCDLSGMGGKGVALRTLVPAKIMNGKKVVILSDMVKMRELMAEEFANLNPVVMESGDAKKKREILNQFRLNELRRLLIAGPQQVNQGVDLSCADVLVLVDLMWKAAKQKQALARLMAPTSKERVVEVIILNSLHSIDEYIYCDFNGKVAGMEQALDKRSVSRTAHEEHWQAYVNQINAEQEALQAFLRETGNDNTIVIPDFMDDLIMERVV
jgi:SNF2 family DNA or RNA helicase